MTPCEVLLHRLALRELHQARDHYHAERSELADRFVAAVRVALQRIADDPDSLAAYRRVYRLIRVTDFPYVIYFRRVDEARVMVVAFAHTARRPNYWVHRKFERN